MTALSKEKYLIQFLYLYWGENNTSIAKFWHRAWFMRFAYQIFGEWINNLIMIYICFIFWYE